MRVVKQIVRFVGRYGIHHEPTYQEVKISLLESNGRWFIQSPWALIDAPHGERTTEDQMGAVLGHNFFDSAEDALVHAKTKAPHWHAPHNQTILGRLYDVIRWDGEIVGVGQLADAVGVSRERLYAICRGEVRATKKQAVAATTHKGRLV